MKAKVRSYRDLVAWQLAYALGLEVHRIARTMPTGESFGLGSQLRRNAISVASNIAEGYGRGARGDYLRFLRVSRGSIYEMDTQLLFARDLQLLDDSTYARTKAMLDESERVLAALIRSLERTKPVDPTTTHASSFDRAQPFQDPPADPLA
ncbi:MAG: four helix bundle protein [Phycisphaerales bacterium]|nr:four helix bundle protein [Phycisphaerales bacterium]